MNKHLVITIDVEPDCTPSWKYSSPLRFAGVSKGIAGRLQPLFNKYNIAPTYLINNVVLEDKESCDIFRALEGKFELGTHLHPEFIGPDKLVYDYAGKKGEANCCFLASEIEFEKIRSITSLFNDNFGYAPTSFRAGRFSAGANTIESLDKLGYKVDTSVTPHIKWADKTREFPVDFSHAAEQPYFIKKNSLLEADPLGAILEVPVTISMKRTRLIQELRRTYIGLRHQIQSHRPLWLRPVFSSLQGFTELVEKYSNSYIDNDSVIFNMMFHNVEVMPGLSPYTRTENDCRAYLYQLEQFFIYCSKNDIRSTTLSDAYQLYR